MIPPSPSILTQPTPRRLNRVPIAIGCFMCATAASVAGYAVYRQFLYHPQTTVTAEEKAADKTKGSVPPDLTRVSVDTGVVRSRAPDGPPATVPPPPVTAAPAAVDSGLTADEQARAQAWTTYYAAQAQLVSAHNALEQSAHSGQMDPLQGAGGGSAQIPGLGQGDQPPPPAGAGQGAFSVGGVNPAGQTGKQAFLRSGGDVMGTDEDLKGSVHGPKPSTIMEGTGIPYRLVEGATSDSPGQLNAEILTNVCDSMTGDLLLIPQGTHTIGTYDVAVSAGQSRMGVIWNRLIFPDTSSRQIGSMSGADQAGLAGMKDLLDTHFWEKWSSAIMVSLIGAGAQLSQPQQSAFATPSGTAQAAGAMTQQLSTFGQEQARAGLSIPNTIELRPGLIGMIKVNKDMPLPAYVDKRPGVFGGSCNGSIGNTAPQNVSMTVGKFIQ